MIVNFMMSIAENVDLNKKAISVRRGDEGLYTPLPIQDESYGLTSMLPRKRGCGHR